MLTSDIPLETKVNNMISYMNDMLDNFNKAAENPANLTEYTDAWIKLATITDVAVQRVQKEFPQDNPHVIKASETLLKSVELLEAHRERIEAGFANELPANTVDSDHQHEHDAESTPSQPGGMLGR